MFNDVILNAPANKVELTYRSLDVLVIDLEINSVGPTKWIEQLFAVAFQS